MAKKPGSLEGTKKDGKNSGRFSEPKPVSGGYVEHRHGEAKGAYTSIGREGQTPPAIAHDRISVHETKEEAVAHALRMTSRPASDIVTIEVRVRVQALAIPEATGGYSLVVPALPGCFSEADTLEEATANVVDAAEAWLAAGHDLNKDDDIRVARGE